MGKKLEVSFKGCVQIQSTLFQPGPLHKPSSFSVVPEALGVKQGCCQSAGKFSASENVSALPLYSTSSCLCAPAVSGLKQLSLDDFTSSHKRASWQKASTAAPVGRVSSFLFVPFLLPPNMNTWFHFDSERHFLSEVQFSTELHADFSKCL